MPQLVCTIADFNLISTWTGYQEWNDVTQWYETKYTTASTVTRNKSFSLSGLPVKAVIDSAVLMSSLGSPYTGAAIRRVDDISFSGTLDVKDKLVALGGNYGSGISFDYKFKANGNTGGLGSHSSSLGFSNNTLTIVYHQPNSLLTLSPSASVDAGATVTASIVSDSPTFTHRITYAIGGHSAYVDASAGQTFKTFSFPLSWLDAVPNGTSIQGTVILATYDGGVLLGTDTKYISVTVPASVIPSISSAVAVRIDGIVPSAWGVYVKGKSKSRLDITCSGIYGSTIFSVTVSGAASGSAGLSGSIWTYTTGFLASAGSLIFTVTITDSRGRTASQNISITVQDYYTPGIQSPTVYRCTSAGTENSSGTYLRFSASYLYASVSGKNSASGRVYYREAPSGSWVDASALLNGSSVVVGAGSINGLKSYEAKIELSDAFSTVAYVKDIGTAACLFDAVGDSRFALFGYADNDGFEVKGNKEIRYKGQTLDARFAPNAHTHDASAITSGVLSAARGGTGRTDGITAKANAMGFAGFGTSEITAQQTDASMAGRTGWATYIIANHGAGASYYHHILGLPFWGPPVYHRMEGGVNGAWHKMYTDENITEGSGTPSGGSDGDIYFKTS